MTMMNLDMPPATKAIVAERLHQGKQMLSERLAVIGRRDLIVFATLCFFFCVFFATSCAFLKIRKARYQRQQMRAKALARGRRILGAGYDELDAASIRLTRLGSSQYDTKSNADTLCNYGRSPLIRDFVDDAARPLPSSHPDSYGGGTGQMNQQMRGETGVKMWHATNDSGGALTPEGTFPVHVQEERFKQKPHPNKNKGTFLSRLFR